MEGFEVILDDTILFPEGGGQPDDRGTIGGIPVTRVRRDGAEAVHFLPAASLPFSVGSEVAILLDWERRFDHMTQHSGQHLITAIADKMLGAPTTSWNLGEKVSSIELDTPSLTADQVTQLETVVNEKIRAALPVYPTLYPDKATLEEEAQKNSEFRQAARGLPDYHSGPLRVVTISGVENNMCCGTHVANTSHLQAIKILSVEKGKKGRTNLLFVAGGRVLKYLGGCLENEKALTGLLKGGPESHVDLVDKLQKNFKNNSKSLTNVLREMALKEVENAISHPPKSGFLTFHTKGDNECMNIIVSGLDSTPITVFLTNGDENKEGNFVLAFPPNFREGSEETARGIMQILDAKGFGKNGRWQGKVSKMINRDRAEAKVAEWVEAKLVQCPPTITKNEEPADEDYPDLSLYTYPNNPKAFKGIICAKYSGICVTVVDQPPFFAYGLTDKSPQFLEKFPNGKLPALEIHGERVHLNESNAIAEYLSADNLMGKTKRQRAEGSQWIQFSNNKILPSLSTWVYHILGVIEITENEREGAKSELALNLKILDDHLLHRTYLVQEHVSTCDVVVVCDLLLAFQHAFDRAFLNNFINLERWFFTVVDQDNFKSVIVNPKFLVHL